MGSKPYLIPRRPRSGRLEGRTARTWLEGGLATCLFALPSLLALIPHGAAPLVAVAGLCAAGIVALDADRPLAWLAFPAALLALLPIWGVVSIAWSIDPGRSLLIAARLAGLFAAGLALAAAAPRLSAPSRLSVALFAGTALGLVVAATDSESAGALTRLVSARPFAGARLNQIAAWLALTALPIAACLGRHRRMAALTAAIAMAAAVYLLADTTAKLALSIGLPVAFFCYFRRAATARIAAAVAVIAIVSVPATLPRLAQMPALFAAVDGFKSSAGHRLLIWSFTGDRIAERPFLGWGLDSARAIPGGKDEIRVGQTWLPLHPHDAALQVWLELGAPGAALLALFAGYLWLQLAAVRWPPLYGAAAAGTLTVALTIALAGWGIWEEWWIATLSFALFAVLALAPARLEERGASFEASLREAPQDDASR